MITQRCRYTLKALMNLAIAGSDQPKRVADIASEENIPERFLGTIMSDLSRHGLVMSCRGKGRGYILLRTAQDITLGEIMRMVDGSFALLPCADEGISPRCTDCNHDAACEVRRVAALAHNAFCSALDRITLNAAAPSALIEPFAMAEATCPAEGANS
jgi:Rrf2 family protein